jgi:hypothetical protein
MAFSQWMVPQLSLSAEAQLQHSLQVLREHGATNIKDTVELACSLAQQNAIQQAIIRQATAHIAELELVQLLRSYEKPLTLRQRLLDYLTRKLGRAD